MELLPARIDTDVRSTSVCWQSYLLPRAQNLVFIDPAFVQVTCRFSSLGAKNPTEPETRKKQSDEKVTKM